MAKKCNHKACFFFLIVPYLVLQMKLFMKILCLVTQLSNSSTNLCGGD